MDISALIFHSLLHLNISSRASTIDTGAVLTFYKKKSNCLVPKICYALLLSLQLPTKQRSPPEPAGRTIGQGLGLGWVQLWTSSFAGHTGLYQLELEWQQKWSASSRVFSVHQERETRARGARKELTADECKNALTERRRFAQEDDHIEKSNLLRQSKLYARKGRPACPRCSDCNQLFVLKCVPWCLCFQSLLCLMYKDY